MTGWLWFAGGGFFGALLGWLGGAGTATSAAADRIADLNRRAQRTAEAQAQIDRERAR